MRRKDYMFMLILVMLSSFLGGAFMSWLLLDKVAFAQVDDKPATIIRAKAFQLVDDRGRIRANLSCYNPSKVVNKRINDSVMHSQIEVRQDEVRFELMDASGTIVWSAPQSFKPTFIK
ncbi:MAG: hypothetical protein V1799_00660 [bacterium]